MSDSNAARIRAAIEQRRPPIDLSPGTAYEAMTRGKVDDLEADVRELRGRVDTLLWSVIAAVVVGVVKMIGGF